MFHKIKIASYIKLSKGDAIFLPFTIFIPYFRKLKLINHTIAKMNITNSSLSEIQELRKEYLDSLPVFQDIYLEFIIAEAFCYKFIEGDDDYGYVIVTEEGLLVEFYIKDKHISMAGDCFSRVIKDLNIKSIYCKTYDFILLDCCLSNKYSYETIGCLFRDFKESKVEYSCDLNIRLAEDSDLTFLMDQYDEVFEPKERLHEFIRNKSIYLACIEDSIVGCGFLTRVNQSYDYYDLGVWVSPDYRKKGYATTIMRYMIDVCKKKNYTPICGCDINNHASRGMLKNLGFISKYKLIESFVPGMG